MNRHFLAALCMTTALMSSHAAAQEKNSTDSYIWYDGGIPRQVWVDRSVVAEFGNRAETESTPTKRSNGVRIWRQGDPAANRAASQGKISPILRDSPRGGSMRALPGNVIVQLDPNWSKANVAAWLNTNGLTEIRRLPIGDNVIVVGSPPGLVSLELANRLQESGTVISAEPNWWEEISQR